MGAILKDRSTSDAAHSFETLVSPILFAGNWLTGSLQDSCAVLDFIERITREGTDEKTLLIRHEILGVMQRIKSLPAGFNMLVTAGEENAARLSRVSAFEHHAKTPERKPPANDRRSRERREA